MAVHWVVQKVVLNLELILHQQFPDSYAVYL